MISVERPVRPLAGAPAFFDSDYVPHEDSSELTVLLSSGPKLIRMIGQEKRHVLYLCDRRNNFYVPGVIQLAHAINALIQTSSISRTILVGGSKAGFGALLLTALCARRNPTHLFRCLAVSPHTSIYPENSNLTHFPSYRLLMRRAALSPGLRAALEKFGDARICQNIPNTYIAVTYGEAYRRDREEADRLFGYNIRKYPLPLGFHGTLTALKIKGQPAGVRRRALDVIFAKLQQDEETRLSVPATAAAFAAQVDRAFWLPSLDELVDEVIRV